MTTQNQLLREAATLADTLDDEFVSGRISNHAGRQAASMLRQLCNALATAQPAEGGEVVEIGQARFDAGCDVLAYLRQEGAPPQITSRMLVCLHGDPERTTPPASQPAEGGVPEGFVSVRAYMQLLELNEKNAERILALEDELDALKSVQPAEVAAVVSCACGDAYPANSYGAGWIDAKGECPNCSAASDASQPAEGGERVFLVATGEIYEGEETYQRYEGSPPPLCDFEVLYTTPTAAQPAEGGEVALPKGFLSDVLTAAGLVRHGKQCKGLADRLGNAYMQIKTTPPASLEQADDKHESDLIEALEDRDKYHEWADQLAEAIAKHTGYHIGEHSSDNNPWRMALNAMECHERASQDQANKKCGTCGFVGKEDPVKGCPRCGWDEMQPASQEPCRSQSGESGPQAGLSITGETQASQEQAQQPASLFEIAADRAEVAKVLRRVSRALDVSTDERTILCHAAAMVELDGQAQQPKPQPMTEAEATAIVREASRNAATRRDGTTGTRIVRAVEERYGITSTKEAHPPITDEQRAIDYYSAAAEQRQPNWVPSRVFLKAPVSGDFPIGHNTIAQAGVHECECNAWGAVSVSASNGERLGIKPAEFRPVAWRANTTADQAPEGGN